MVSLLQYANLQSNDPKYLMYQPYRLLISNIDTSNKQYPVTFENKVMKGCICYNIKAGISNDGINFNF
jgi:hypothetical protein